MPGQIVFDCEGPITLNDNALELCEYFIPEGGRFFSQISRYDDFLADLERKPGYKAGDTLKLILPFLKVFGGTNQTFQDYSRRNLLLLPDAEEMLSYLLKSAPVFIISTSYEPYIKALCEEVGFPLEQTYCTQIDLDKYEINIEDEKTIKGWLEEILTMPLIELPASATGLEELPDEVQASLNRLDQIFWREIPSTSVQKMLDEINPVGGTEKARALENSLERTSLSLSQVMYVGDSITDVQVFDLVKGNGGLAASFNGNRYALQSAEVACISENSFIVTVLADIFLKSGKEGVIRLVEDWDLIKLTQSELDSDLKSELGRRYLEKLPVVKIVDDQSRLRLVQESEDFRTKLRGMAGKLG